MTAPTSRAPQPQALRVLLVEDDAVNRILAGLVVHSVTGIEPEIAASGEEALALLQEQPFDLVLMDMYLPGIDGPETARRIRALPAPQRACAIVALTGSDAPQDIQRCRAAGMVAHLLKPMDAQALRRTLAELTVQITAT